MTHAESLPIRITPVPQTTDGVPHVQIGVKAVAELAQALMDHVSKFPGVNLGPTRVSMPGGVGFQLEDDVLLARPDVIVGGQEFAHLHTDGSLHASLSPDVALAAIDAGWAVAHPWAKQREGWDGFVMVFTPTTFAELEVVTQLVESSYGFVTGHGLPE
ncbi:luciferase family protein [Aliiroseovarius sp. M344]|uniref:luciferase domain-containing protein n=1 Tax=Aliiroseovarius sp. M344 TaxID=2867010 RepID=UPI0021AE12AF|nr:luciferase family protein [Aliiroseovarius sp. M344]